MTSTVEEYHKKFLDKAAIIKQSTCYNCEHFLIIARWNTDPHPLLENGDYCMLDKEKPLKLQELKKECENQKTWSKSHHCLNCHVDRDTKVALACIQCGGYYPGDCICCSCCCDSCKIEAYQEEEEDDYYY